MIKNKSIVNILEIYGWIYEHINLFNKKKYIGQTVQKKGFRYLSNYKRHPYFYNALKKYGFENFETKIIDSAQNKEELDEKEDFYIKKFNTLDSNFGYNLRHGGSNGKHSEKTKKELSIKTKERYEEYPEIKEQISKSLKEYYKENPVSKEKRNKLSESLKGKKPWNKGLTKENDKRIEKLGWSNGLTKETDERVRKRSELQKGISKSKEWKEKMSEYHKNNPNSGTFLKDHIPWNKGMNKEQMKTYINKYK